MLSRFYPSDLPGDQPHRAILRVEVVTPDPETVLVIPVGEADLSTADRLRQALNDGLSMHRSHVVVDLDQLSFLDAAALGVLAEARSRHCAAGGELRVRCRNALTVEMLALTGMDGLIEQHG